MSDTTTREPKTAIVIGVGALQGLGAQLCLRFAREGHHVFAAGRTQSSLDQVGASAAAGVGHVTPVVADATSEADVQGLFERAMTQGAGALDLAVYNAGNNTPGAIREMEADYFERSWRVVCFGGFLFGREAARRMLPGGGTLLFTGASASLRGRPDFGAFSAAKGALRNLAQAIAKEHGHEGLHVGHVVIDGGIDGERLRSRRPEAFAGPAAEAFISLEGLTDAYWYLYRQPKRAWTFELDLRTGDERW
ncbi:MAG: SDR family NAD(P)-dependent oxidoreductase [Gammaproteobacteria bacterium]